MRTKVKPLGTKYWWLPASISFGPLFMVFMPRFVDNELLQMGILVIGCMMQFGVNAHLFRKVREHESALSDEVRT